MENYIITTNGELYHYGVLGMKWGRRKATYNSSSVFSQRRNENWNQKSQSYKRTSIERGQNPNLGRTKHNYRTGETVIGKNVSKYAKDAINNRNSKKAEKQQFKKDVKQYRHDKRILDADINEYGQLSNVRNRGHEMLDRRRVEKGEEYANRIIKSDKRRTTAETVGVLVGSAAAMVGYSYLAAKYNF